MLFDIMTGAIILVACLPRCIFAPEPTIASLFLLVEFGGFLIQFIKIIIGFLISILFVIAPNRHSHPSLLPQSLFLW